jgi:hypothetical protein
MRPKLEPRPCIVCAVPFTPKRKDTARICSNRCKVKHHRQVRADKWWEAYDQPQSDRPLHQST